jgi:mannose-6-phosphate isomerase-like protein (cupin superfamily)
MQAISLKAKFARCQEPWQPKIIAQLNGYHVKVARLRGEFVWHAHAETDELFLVHRGAMVIRFRDGEVRLGAGDLYVVPRGVEHCPVAEADCEVLLIEPAGTVNTGDAGGERTAPDDEWI